jgi:imidazolonepropionase-like amidohydrolase
MRQFPKTGVGGKYVLPGLINMHVHLPASGKPKKKASDPKKLVKLITFCALTNRIGVSMCEGYAKTELLSGVTTIRTVGGVADYDTKIRDLAAAGKILAPRVLASNMAVSVPGGHMAGSPTRRTPPKRPRRSSKRSPPKSPTSSS